jgi:hypothetical protein
METPSHRHDGLFTQFLGPYPPQRMEDSAESSILLYFLKTFSRAGV